MRHLRALARMGGRSVSRTAVRTALRASLLTLPAITACGYYLADGPECRPVGSTVSLPGSLSETSGVATGIRNPALVWTHNDRGNGPVLYAVDREGRVRARVEVNRRNDDWEDIARGPCDLGACLYIAGTGDNSERRDDISLYRLAEPEGEGEQEVEAERYRMELPDGPRDIEAMFILPTEQIFFVTKGRNHPVTVYRYPSPLRSEEVVTLVEVQRLTSRPSDVPRMVTGASATLDGRTVAIRTYESLEFFDVTEGEQRLDSSLGRLSLRSVGGFQGEGVGFGADGVIVLTSESVAGFSPSLTYLSCDVGSAPLSP